jgi:hypothetical protein
VEYMGKKSNACRILLVKIEGKRPCGRTRSGWKYNIKMHFQEV